MMEYISELLTHLTNDKDTFDFANELTIGQLTSTEIIEAHRKIQNIQQLLILHIDNMTKLENLLIDSVYKHDTLYHPLEGHFYEEYKNIFKVRVQNDVVRHKTRNITLPEAKEKTCEEINGINIQPLKIHVPIVDNLKSLKPIFSWYNGDDYNKPGIYASITDGFVVKIPFADLMSSDDPFFKTKSIRCKYETIESCRAHKKKIAEVYGLDTRDCSYVHKKEKFIRVGTQYRCSIQSFGSHKTLIRDMPLVNHNDLKLILMNSLTDTLLSLIWYQNYFGDGNLLLTNLDKY